MKGAATESGVSSDEEYSLALDRILADPEQPHIVFQPIADLYRGVVAGYECLSRFHAGVSATPDVWFRLAEKRGRGVELELRALQAAIRARDRLPDDTFLTINLSPDALASEAIRPILRGAGTLSRLVIEITEHSAVSDYRSLTEAVSAVRTEGGLVAVDDAGAGYASLRHVLELRPNFVKLDRSLIARIDLDPAMIAVVQMLGDFTSRLDAWLIAEGIERTEELDVLASLGVPLAQGFLLGKPDRSWTTLSEVHRERLAARRNDPGHTENVISLAELRPCVTTGSDREELRCAFLSCPGAAYLVQVDGLRRPVGIIRRSDLDQESLSVRKTLIVGPTTPLRDAAWRAMQRPEESRFDPLICTTTGGEYFGIVPIERLVTALAG